MNYEDYMTKQPMTDGEEIRSFLDDEEKSEEPEDLLSWGTNVFRKMQDGYINNILKTLK